MGIQRTWTISMESAMVNHTCPVCAYDQMPYPPDRFEICPCCGTEFGYHDHNRSRRELRNLWLARGAPCFNPIDAPPLNWNPYLQLVRAGFDFDVPLPDDPLVDNTDTQV